MVVGYTHGQAHIIADLYRYALCLNRADQLFVEGQQRSSTVACSLIYASENLANLPVQKRNIASFILYRPHESQKKYLTSYYFLLRSPA